MTTAKNVKSSDQDPRGSMAIFFMNAVHYSQTIEQRTNILFCAAHCPSVTLSEWRQINIIRDRITQFERLLKLVKPNTP